MVRFIKNHVAASWSNVSITQKVFIIVIFATSIIILTINLSMFSFYHKKSRSLILEEAKLHTQLHGRRINTGVRATEESLRGLRKATNMLNNIEESTATVVDLFNEELAEHAPALNQVIFADPEGKPIIKATKPYIQKEVTIESEFIDLVLNTHKGDIVWSDVDQETSVVNLATPTNHGIIIMSIESSPAFQESINTFGMFLSKEGSRAIINETGKYVWKYPNYKSFYGDNERVHDDFSNFPSTPYIGESGAVVLGKDLVSFSPIKSSAKNVNWIIIEIFDIDEVSTPVNALRNTLIGISIACIGIMSCLLLFVSKLIDLETNIMLGNKPTQ